MWDLLGVPEQKSSHARQNKLDSRERQKIQLTRLKKLIGPN